MRVNLFLLAALLLASVPALANDSTTFRTRMTGAQEVPVAVSTGGFARARVRFDEGFTRLNVNIRIRNLEGAPFGLHFHCNVAGANGPIALGIVSPGPLSFDGNQISGRLTNDDFPDEDACLDVIGRPVNNVASLAAAIDEGLIYLNLHTDFSPPGEVRGQLLESDDGPGGGDSDDDSDG